jgi:RimJ/RimL family protein N-acetyltransferase
MAEPTESVSCDGWDNSECEGTAVCPPRCPRFVDTEGTPTHIRPLEDDDISSLVTMYEHVDWNNRTMGIPPQTRASIREWVESLSEEGWNLVVTIEDKIVGHIGVAPAEQPRPQFVVFVHQDYQGRGIGTELLKQLIAHTAAEDYEGLTLTASADNERALTLYENSGFEVTGRETGRAVDGTHVEMELSFPHPVANRVRLPPADR